MLLASIKRLIDRARDALVGKIPDPKGQIDQITSALIYKFMDDLDQAAILIGGKPSFFVDDMERFAWHKLFVPQISNQQRADLYAEGISKLSNAEHLPSLFRDIFKDAFVPFRAADTIALFLNEINEFPPYQKNSEELGNAFEYLLHFMGTQGDAGQFRTPRHIIDFIVDVVAPNKSDTILDPACGTAGFLVSAYKFITNNFKQLTQREITTLAKNIKGVDIDPQMAKIARVNLYLHGFNTPEITEDDTLTNEELWGQKYNVILANPPFMTPTGGIRPHEKFGLMANRSEVLFVDYIAEHLRLQGRAGIIVPEGIIFQSAKAYKELRKKLIEDWGLYAVVSLPSGIFNPYSGVKTSILFLDRGFSSSDVLFVKIKNDGYDLGAQRRENDKNDLPVALSVIQQWKDTQRIPVEALAHNVSKKTIAENGEYNFTGERYREVPDYSNAKWEMVKLEDVCKIVKHGVDEFKDTKKYYSTGSINYNKAEEFDLVKFENKPSRADILPKLNDVGFAVMKDTAKIILIDNQLENSIFSTGFCFLRNKEQLNYNYLYHIVKSDIFQAMKNKKSQDSIMGGIRKGDILNLEIPLPPLEVQEQIAAEIGGYQKVIDGAKQIIANWKPQIKINSDWQMVNLGEVCEFVRGPFGGSLKKEIFVKKGFAVYEQSHAIYENFYDFRYFITPSKFKEMKRFEVTPNDLIMSCSGTMGKTAIVPKNSPAGIINQALLKITTKENLLAEFLKLWMDSESFQTLIFSKAGGVAIQNVPSVKVLSTLKTPLPPLKTQKQIVAEIESEQHAVTECKTLIAKMEQKISDKIGELWGDKV